MTVPPRPIQSADDVSEADIRDALARVVASDPFRAAPQLCAFLTFVVDATVEGREREIKGYTIATQAFGRSENFDPQTDPIVRVEAMRLRKALEAYYSEDGKSDPLRIDIPRGSYVPHFRRQTIRGEPIGDEPEPDIDIPAECEATASETADSRQPSVAVANTHRISRGRIARLAAGLAIIAVVAGLGVSLRPGLQRKMESPTVNMAVEPGLAIATAPLPVIAIQPLEHTQGRAIGNVDAALMDRIIEDLARFDEVTVIDLSRTRSAAQDARDKRGVRYRLAMRLSSHDGKDTVVARLTYATSDEVVWAQEYSAPQGAEAVETLSRSIARTIAKTDGVVFADVRSRRATPEQARCLLAAHDYWRGPNEGLHGTVRQCLKTVLAQDPTFYLAQAALAYADIDEYRLGFNSQPGSPLDRALEHARQAVELAPESARAAQALMAAQFARGDTEAAIDAGQRAIQLNPLDPDLQADLGARYIALGQYEKGRALILKAASGNPAVPPWYHFYLFLSAFMQNDTNEARLHANRIASDTYVLGLIARIAVHDGTNQEIHRKNLIAQLVRIAPELRTNTMGFFARRQFAPEIVERLTTALRKAGIDAHVSTSVDASSPG